MGQIDRAMIYFTLATVCLVVGALAYVGDNIPQEGFSEPRQAKSVKPNSYESYIMDVVEPQRDLLSEHNEANP
jgi:hypothetical protein|tara:strand:+ start:490 stop:708 length:219 start_codon:yes stop_codon:yes gene_type:complete